MTPERKLLAECLGEWAEILSNYENGVFLKKYEAQDCRKVN